MLDQKKTEITGEYGLIVGGYRVVFSNYFGEGRESFFQNPYDAHNFLAKYKVYGYKGSVETIYFKVVGA